MACGWKKYISGFVDRELDLSEQQRFIKHLEVCKECKESLEGAKLLHSTLKSTFRRKGIIPPTIGFVGKLEERIQKERRSLFDTAVYYRSEYRLVLAMSMFFFLLGESTYDIGLTLTVFLFFWIHLYLYVSDITKGKVKYKICLVK